MYRVLLHPGKSIYFTIYRYCAQSRNETITGGTHECKQNACSYKAQQQRHNNLKRQTDAQHPGKVKRAVGDTIVKS